MINFPERSCDWTSTYRVICICFNAICLGLHLGQRDHGVYIWCGQRHVGHCCHCYNWHYHCSPINQVLSVKLS